MGRVAGIYLAGAAGEPMHSVAAAVALAGRGLEGDRYCNDTGHWSFDRRLVEDVTLIAVEALAEAEAEHGVRLADGASRRNLETLDVDLDALIGRTFRIGDVLLRGDRPCDPCRYLDGLTGQPAKAALSGRGGLRATVLRGGSLRVGDEVTTAEATTG